MKINGIRAGIPTEIKKKKETVKRSGFHTLLKSNLGAVGAHEKEGKEQGDEEQRADMENARLIKDATGMLDRAMEQIHENGAPDSAVVESLQRLSHHLEQLDSHTTSEEGRIADVLVTVEVQRLKNW